jgi:hypothetical protein
LTHNDATTGSFANDIALSGELIVAGKFSDDELLQNAGSLFAFEIPDFTSPYCFSGPCPCGNDSVLAGCRNATGEGALLTACGTTSVAVDDLLLNADDLPPSQFGLFYMGAAATDLPFGDGRRCVGAGGSGTYRYFPLQNSGADRRITLGPGIVAHSLGFATPGRIDAGETWHFQVWYRDPQGPCGSAYNLSNGIEILFQL